MGIIDQILEEAESELFPKVANDQNGAPTEPAQQQGGGDVFAAAQAYLAKVEQFKGSLGQMAAASAPGGEAAAPGEMAPPGGEPGAPPAATDGGIIIARPDGTQIKVAELKKLASLRSNGFQEVK